MAAESVRDLLTRLIFKVDKGSQADAERAGEATKKAAERASEGWVNFTARIGLAIEGLRALGRIAKGIFVGLILSFTNTTDEAAKTARAVGVTVGKLQELNFAAQLSGGSTQDVTKILGQLAKAGREASKGTKTFVEAFDDLGVKVTDSRGKLKSTDELLGDVSDRFKVMKDGSEKTALAMKLFGRAGAKMIPFLSEGREGLAKMGADARRLGIVLSDEAAKKAENFNDQLLRAKSAVQGVRNRIALALLPTLTAMAERFAAFASDGDRVEGVLEAVKLAARVLGSVLATLAARQLVGVVAGFASYVIGLFAVDAASKKAALSTRLLGGALGLLKATGILLIAAALADLFKLATGKESEIAKALGPAGAEDLKRVVLELGGILKNLLKELAPALADLLKAIAPLIPPIAKVLGFLGRMAAIIAKGIVFGLRLVMKLFQSIGRVAGDIASGIASAWDATIGAIITQIGDWISALGGVKRIGEIILAPFEAIREVIEWIIGKIAAVTKFARDVGGAIGRGTIGGIDTSDIEELKRRVSIQTKAFKPAGGPGFGPAAAMGGRAGAGTVVNQANQSANTFNISGAGDPQAVADRVASTLAAKVQENQDAQMRQALANLRGG